MSVTKANTIQCGNITAESSTITFDNNVLCLGSVSGTTVIATQLGTTGDSVIIGTAAPPTTGQVLRATSATTAAWETLTGNGGGGGWVDTATSNLDMACFAINNVDQIRVGNVYGKSPIDIHDTLNIRSTALGGNITFEGGIIIGNTTTNTSSTDSIAIGKGSETLSSHNTAIGTDCVTRGDNCISIGYQIGPSNASATGQNNIGLGKSALSGMTTSAARNNIAIGSTVGTSITTGKDNIVIGNTAGNDTTTGSYNIAIGYTAKQSGSSVTNNSIGIGRKADPRTNNSIAIGTFPYCVGARQIAIGYKAYTQSANDSSVAIGTLSTSNNTNSVAIGYNAQASGSASIAIGQSASASASNGVALGTGTVASLTDGCFLRHRVTAYAGSNCILVGTVTGEIITAASSQRYKTNIRNLEDVGSKIDQIRPVRYETRDKDCAGLALRENIGIIAEELEDIFPEFVTYGEYGISAQSINYPHIVAILIKEIQSLRARVYALENP